MVLDTKKAEFNCKIAIIGDGGVGKTSIRRKFLGQAFQSSYMETIGADFSTKSIEIEINLNKVSIAFQIWDLAGQPKFINVRKLFYDGSQGLIFVFDITRFDSLENIKKWVEEVIKNGISCIPVLLIGNKYDLMNTGVVCCSKENDVLLAEFIHEKLNKKSTSVNHIRTSAKTGHNVEQAFNILAREIYFKYLESMN